MNARKSLFDLIPGLREAVDQERFDRSVAFLGLPEKVCGVDCRPLTMLDVVRLDCIGNPFACGGQVLPVHIGAFIKLQCTAKSSVAKWFILQRMAKRYTLERASAEIQSFIVDSFADAPPSTGGRDDVVYWTSAHSLIDALGQRYGWTIKETLETPLKVLLPLLNVARKQNDPSTPLFNPRSDKIRGEWLAASNTKN